MKANFNLGTTARKLVITNKTKWDTRALRTVFLKVINENIKFEGPLKHLIRCTVVDSRKRWHGRYTYSGYAYLHSGTMRLRVPPPTDRCQQCQDGHHYRAIEDGKLVDPSPCPNCNGTKMDPNGLTLDTFKLAHLFEHELAHCRGYKHKGMCSLNSWEPRPGDYAYLDGFKVSAKFDKPKPVIDCKVVRAARIDARIKTWETKLKRAETALKKLRRQQAYYQKKEDVS